MITHRLVVSYTTFSPLPHTRRGGCFLLPTPAVADSFYFRKWGSLCCPDFPLLRLCTAATEPRHCFQQTAKLLKIAHSEQFLVVFFIQLTVAEVSGLRSKLIILFDLVLRRPETSATNRLQMRYKMLEVDTQAEREAAVVRCIELVVTDVRESDIVGEVGVEEVVRHAATEAQTGVEALEVVV